jgi:gas vesicle protein
MKDSQGMSYFLLGLGVGAAVGVLFAPKSGPETRNYLQAKVNETADTLTRQGQELRNRAVETVKNLADAVDPGKVELMGVLALPQWR